MNYKKFGLHDFILIATAVNALVRADWPAVGLLFVASASYLFIVHQKAERRRLNFEKYGESLGQMKVELETLGQTVSKLREDQEGFAKQSEQVKELLSKGTLMQAFASSMPRSLK